MKKCIILGLTLGVAVILPAVVRGASAADEQAELAEKIRLVYSNLYQKRLS
jgi:hypothetical protein